jgi:hypothetical protein
MKSRLFLISSSYPCALQEMRTSCPSILTYEDGCHVAFSGETGGKRYRAPSRMQDLPAYFGSGPRPAAAAARQKIDALKQLEGLEKNVTLQ